MKNPSRRKTRPPKAKVGSPPAKALRALAAAACRDHALARLALSFISSILRDESSRLFAQNLWCRRDLVRTPEKLRDAVRALEEWSQRPEADVYPLYACAQKISAAVVKMRRNSPFGRRCVEIAEQFRTKYPRSNEPRYHTASGATRIRTVGILESFKGLPLSLRTMAVVEALKASSIQIASHREFLPFRSEAGLVGIRLGADGYTVESIELTVEVKQSVEEPERIEGELFDYAETGTEGLIWSVYDGENFDHDALHTIKAGDHLTVSDSLGHEIWAGTIQCDCDAGWQRYSLNPKLGQPSALGYWIHWTQKGFEPDDWARFFVRPPYDRCHGVLLRKSGGAKIDAKPPPEGPL